MTSPLDRKVAELERKLSDNASQLASQSGDIRRIEGEAKAVSQRLERHSGAVDIRLAALAGGLTALQTSPPPAKSFPDTLNAWAEPLGKILMPFLLLGAAWFINNSVEAALKEREVVVSTAQGMQSQLTILRGKNRLTQADADAAALVLATFGRPSIMLLVLEHDLGGTVEEAVAADKALLVLGLTNKDDLCGALDAVLGDKGRRFRIETHTMAARHIGQAQCEGEKKILGNSRDWIKSRPPGDSEVIRKYRDGEELTVKKIEDLRGALDDALNLLKL